MARRSQDPPPSASVRQQQQGRQGSPGPRPTSAAAAWDRSRTPPTSSYRGSGRQTPRGHRSGRRGRRGGRGAHRGNPGHWTKDERDNHRRAFEQQQQQQQPDAPQQPPHQPPQRLPAVTPPWQIPRISPSSLPDLRVGMRARQLQPSTVFADSMDRAAEADPRLHYVPRPLARPLDERPQRHYAEHDNKPASQ